MSKKSVIQHVIIALMTTSLSTPTNAASMGQDVKGMEKCYGVAKKGQNDCGTASHNCAGESTQDGYQKEWVYVPNGLCNKIVGGKTDGNTK